MGRRLASFVHVMDEHQQAHVFGPDDKVPAWAKAAITNPKAWASDKDDDDSGSGGSGDGSGSAPPPAFDGPPKSGAGSGKEAWRAYAKSIEVEVAEDASREDVVAAIEAAGKPTE